MPKWVSMQVSCSQPYFFQRTASVGQIPSAGVIKGGKSHKLRSNEEISHGSINKVATDTA